MTEATLPVRRAAGLLCIPDPHLAGAPPMQRLESYTDDVLAKLTACLELAAARDLLPVVLGDLFHWPRENPNSLMVALIDLFGPVKPYVLVGNHDKYQARFTADTSLAVLRAAGVVRVLDAPGLFLRLETPTGPALIGASPDGAALPSGLDPAPGETTVWLTHHNVSFPDYQEKYVRIREIPGLDWVINGHIHQPQPTIVAGRTHWANPGGTHAADLFPPHPGPAALGRHLAAGNGRRGTLDRAPPALRGGLSGPGISPRGDRAWRGRVAVSRRPGPAGLAADPRRGGAPGLSGRQSQSRGPRNAVYLGTLPRGDPCRRRTRRRLRPTTGSNAS